MNTDQIAIYFWIFAFCYAIGLGLIFKVMDQSFWYGVGVSLFMSTVFAGIYFTTVLLFA
jgi:hypothetical protein